MYSKVISAVSSGFSGLPIEIETFISSGLPYYSVVGLPSAVVRESKERVRAALSSVGEDYPNDRITQNLIPAFERKEGSHLDLPLAVGIYCAQRTLKIQNRVMFFGELALDGAIRRIDHFVSLIMVAISHGYRHFVVPEGNREEAKQLAGCEIDFLFFRDLSSLFAALSDISKKQTDQVKNVPTAVANDTPEIDFVRILGQDRAVRALTISAVGDHHTLLSGPPGCGKTMLATAYPGILAPPSPEEALEIGRVHGESMIGRRPVRTVHHSVTQAGLIGGGAKLQIGEITKASGGVLLLEEFGEYKRDVIELLREPMESGSIQLARGGQCQVFPARFTLLATMNPCRCGNYHMDNYDMACRCTQRELKTYYSKFSWPILDRFHLYVSLERPDFSASPSKTSSELKECVIAARRLRLEMERQRSQCIDAHAKSFLEQHYQRNEISMRSMRIVESVAKSIAALDGSAVVQVRHIKEAISYSPIERMQPVRELV